MKVEQSIGFLGDLVRSALRGDLGVPAFQRPYVWTEDDVEAFFASVLARFPVGSFLVWDAGGAGFPEGVTGRLGPLAPAHAPERLLLDGQNRLATMMWASMTGESGGVSDHERSVWRSGRTLVADAATRSVRFVPDGETDDGPRIPMGAILSSVFGDERIYDRMHGMLGRCTEEEFNWLFDGVADAVRSSKIVTTTLRGASLEEARQAFLAVCRAGQPMTEEDFENAVTWSPPAAAVP